MEKEQIEICKELLKAFIYKIKVSLKHNSGVSLVFHYYTDSELDDFKTYPVNTPEFYSSFNFERTKRQIKKRILSNRNNYWNFNDSQIKILEDFCINNPKEFDNIFKEYIEKLWKCDLKQQEEEFEQHKQKIKEESNNKLKEILKDKYETYQEVINLILEDTKEYPYKSDKIKVLLELELDIDTIFLILQTKEKWVSPKGYINKYFEERKEGIRQKKITVYELTSVIKYVTNQLKSYK